MEMLVVFAVIGLMAAIVLPQFSALRQRQVLKSAASETLSALARARSNSLGSAGSSEYGVYFSSSQVIIFKGLAYSAGAADNETISIASPASITNVTLAGVSGTTGQMYFNRLYGVPSSTGTITITSGSYSKTITISATGAASIN